VRPNPEEVSCRDFTIGTGRTTSARTRSPDEARDGLLFSALHSQAVSPFPGQPHGDEEAQMAEVRGDTNTYEVWLRDYKILSKSARATYLPLDRNG
jgi:hypothetical protein